MGSNINLQGEGTKPKPRH